MTPPVSRTNDLAAARAETMQALSELWRLALDPIVRGGSCGCCSSPGVVLRSDWLELDILDYLEGSYAKVDNAALRHALDRRRSNTVGAFMTWLAGLEDEGLSGDDARRLRTDIAIVLSRMAHLHDHAAHS